MEVRWSPYNSPFVPAGDTVGIYWVGLEHRNAPCSAHVAEYHRQSAASVILENLDDLAADGIKAAARRAIAIRRVLADQKPISLPSKLPAKRKVCR